MRRRFVALVLFVFTLNSCTQETTEITIITEVLDDKLVESEVLAVVNDYRSSLGLSALKFNEVAYEYAGLHNDYMIKMGSISHANFSSRATDIASLTSAKFVAENVAKNYANAEEVLQGWMDSATHKATLEGDFTHTGISVKVNENGQLYYTQIFFR